MCRRLSQYVVAHTIHQNVILEIKIRSVFIAVILSFIMGLLLGFIKSAKSLQIAKKKSHECKLIKRLEIGCIL